MAKKDSNFNVVDTAAKGLTAALKEAARVLETEESPQRSLNLCTGFADSMQTGGYTDAVLLKLDVMPITTPKILELARTHQQKHLVAILERGLTVEPDRQPEPAAA